MRDKDAIAAMAALANGHRLGLYRLLMWAGPSGMAAGDLAARLELSRSSLSFHVAQLERAGLVHARREHRNIYYAVQIDSMRRLLTFLTQDCCNGNPDICGDLAAAAAFCGPIPETEQ